MNPLALSVRVERWPIAGTFSISRGAKTEAVVVVAELSDGTHRGRGECVPYAHYGETVGGVAAAIEAMRAEIGRGLDRERLQSAMGPGAARNAIDCAFWDLAAKRAGQPVHELLGMPPPKAVTTAYTISLATPEVMAQAAARAGERALLKVKLGAPGDPARIAAVRRAAPRGVDRRCQRGLDGERSRHKPRRLRRGGRDAHRAAAAGEPRQRARAHCPPAPDLRGRERAGEPVALRARGQV